MLSVDEYVNTKYNSNVTRRNYKRQINKGLEYLHTHGITTPTNEDFEAMRNFFKGENTVSESERNGIVQNTKKYLQEGKEIPLFEEKKVEAVEADVLEPKTRVRKSIKSGTIEAMNFKIDAELKKDFLLLCEIAKKTATDIITDYIKRCVVENKEEIERYTSVKDTFTIKL